MNDNIFVGKPDPVGEDTKPKDRVSLGLSPSTVVEDMDSTQLLLSKIEEARVKYDTAYIGSTYANLEQDVALTKLYNEYVDLFDLYTDRMEDV